MTRERFIKKWLGNNDFNYCEEHKELMREDLDSVIDYHQEQVNSVGLADVVGRSEQFYCWESGEAGVENPLCDKQCDHCSKLYPKQ